MPSDAEGTGDYQCDDHPEAWVTLTTRAREDPETWGSKQVVECRHCQKRWSV